MHRARLFINSAASPHTVLACSRLLDEMAATAAAAAGGACVGMPVAAAAGGPARLQPVRRVEDDHVRRLCRDSPSGFAACFVQRTRSVWRRLRVRRQHQSAMRHEGAADEHHARRALPRAARQLVPQWRVRRARAARQVNSVTATAAGSSRSVQVGTSASSTGTRGAAPLATSRGRAR